ncbi:haloacid dehalogenase type II [Metallosphaera tengchongensis]|uniref:Haloacid dehalogenase type II n=1 Tax=Metallosphaera tengchongensis TaxID=1532350 RepID=A0A6N0NZ61_9CREN|nr:haloacid dehalogenase type II [Metallosphaera tengchongensis]QKR00658.1 haloacid dehalogenase type II [Metallosphaera tengchongensis]
MLGWSMRLRLAFDVFGTILDLSTLPYEFRRKQLEYTWLLTVMGKFVPFHEVTEKAMTYYLEAEGKLGDYHTMMEKWRDLKAFTDVSYLNEISSLADIFALSNGSVEEVKDRLRREGILNLFKGIFSAEEVKAYKPSPKVYRHFVENVGEPAFLVSSNPFDLMGAKNAGMGAIYLNRRGVKLDPLGFEVDLLVKDLKGLFLWLREKA